MKSSVLPTIVRYFSMKRINVEKGDNLCTAAGKITSVSRILNSTRDKSTNENIDSNVFELSKLIILLTNPQS